MDSIVSMILNRSKVTVEHIKIVQATTDSLTMSLVNRVTGTGPTSATMAPMVVDLVFGGQAWGKLQIPEVITSPSGTTVVCAEQEVAITNLDSFRAFVRALECDEELVLVLDNGDCHITAKVLGVALKANVVYRQELVIRGMGGPKVNLVATKDGHSTMKVGNPSPLELNHGVSLFDILDASTGEKVASLKGPLTVVRGDFDSTLDITFAGKAVAAGTKLRLVGKGTEKKSWLNDTLQYIDTEFAAGEEFAALSG